MDRRFAVNAITGMNGWQEPLISAFAEKDDAEIAAFVCALVSNTYDGADEYAAHVVLYQIMGGKPSEYLREYEPYKNFGEVLPLQSFHKSITFGDLSVFLLRIKETKEEYGSMEKWFVQAMSKRPQEYGHTALADLFADVCALPNSYSDSTFYRFNLLIYYLTYKFGIWERHTSIKVLVPCDSLMLSWRRRTAGRLANAEKVTEDAVKAYGEDFYKMFEELNYGL